MCPLVSVGGVEAMSQNKSFTVDQVGWQTKTPGNTEPRDITHARFRAVIDFLQDNGLTNRTILQKEDPIDDETQIHTDALTPEGLLILQKCYQKWLRKVDHGLDPNDVSIFENTMNTL
jgi:hypothetical protein